jgi:hypothetical protein
MKRSLQISLAVVALSVATLTMSAYKKENRGKKAAGKTKVCCLQKKQQQGDIPLHANFLPVSM